MSTINVQSITNGTDTISVNNSIKGSARAWINYDGTTDTTRDSYNVSALVDLSAGSWSISFTNNMPNANYVVMGMSGYQGDTWAQVNPQYIPQCSALSVSGFKAFNASTIGGVPIGFDYMGYVVYSS